MANNENNDKELNDYLDGNSDLSKTYRASTKPEPSSYLDNAILSAAKDAVDNPEHKEKKKFKKSPWTVPVSIAAMVTLSVSLVVTMQQEAGRPIISEPEIEMYDSAVFVEEREKPESTMATTSSNDEVVSMDELELKEEKTEVTAEGAAALGAVGGYRGLLKNEKVQKQTEVLEESIISDEQVMQSAPAAAIEFDGALSEVELKQKKDARANTAAARQSSASSDLYRAKEKPQFEVIEESAYDSDQVLPSAPAGAEFDDAISQPQKRQLTKEKSRSETLRGIEFPDVQVKTMKAEMGFRTDEAKKVDVEDQNLQLKAIKVLWKNDDFKEAKEVFDELIKHYPNVTEEKLRKTLGANTYYGLLNF